MREVEFGRRQEILLNRKNYTQYQTKKNVNSTFENLERPRVMEKIIQRSHLKLA
jgi:hypothetical protein